MSTSSVEDSVPHLHPVITKTPLRVLQRGLVEQATIWARALVQREARGPGDIPAAMHRLAARHGISHHAFWTLRYRAPRDVAASIYFRLKEAYEYEIQRQLRLLEIELAVSRAKLGASHPVVASVEASLGTVDGEGE